MGYTEATETQRHRGTEIELFWPQTFLRAQTSGMLQALRCWKTMLSRDSVAKDDPLIKLIRTLCASVPL
jgi:hypothetical protein